MINYKFIFICLLIVHCCCIGPISLPPKWWFESYNKVWYFLLLFVTLIVAKTWVFSRSHSQCSLCAIFCRAGSKRSLISFDSGTLFLIPTSDISIEPCCCRRVLYCLVHNNGSSFTFVNIPRPSVTNAFQIFKINNHYFSADWPKECVNITNH